MENRLFLGQNGVEHADRHETDEPARAQRADDRGHIADDITGKKRDLVAEDDAQDNRQCQQCDSQFGDLLNSRDDRIEVLHMISVLGFGLKLTGGKTQPREIRSITLLPNICPRIGWAASMPSAELTRGPFGTPAEYADGAGRVSVAAPQDPPLQNPSRRHLRPDNTPAQ